MKRTETPRLDGKVVVEARGEVAMDKPALTMMKDRQVHYGPDPLR